MSSNNVIVMLPSACPNAAKQKVSQTSINIVPASSTLHCPPEVVCVEVPREFGVDVDNVHIALCGIANDGFVVLASCWVGFNVDAECAVEPQL